MHFTEHCQYMSCFSEPRSKRRDVKCLLKTATSQSEDAPQRKSRPWKNWFKRTLRTKKGTKTSTAKIAIRTKKCPDDLRLLVDRVDSGLDLPTPIVSVKESINLLFAVDTSSQGCTKISPGHGPNTPSSRQNIDAARLDSPTRLKKQVTFAATHDIFPPTPHWSVRPISKIIVSTKPQGKRVTLPKPLDIKTKRTRKPKTPKKKGISNPYKLRPSQIPHVKTALASDAVRRVCARVLLALEEGLGPKELDRRRLAEANAEANGKQSGFLLSEQFFFKYEMGQSSCNPAWWKQRALLHEVRLRVQQGEESRKVRFAEDVRVREFVGAICRKKDVPFYDPERATWVKSEYLDGVKVESGHCVAPGRVRVCCCKKVGAMREEVAGEGEEVRGRSQSRSRR